FHVHDMTTTVIYTLSLHDALPIFRLSGKPGWTGDSLMQPLVGVIMGSKSDWPTLEHAVQMLEKLGISYETRVVSAHRTPDLLFRSEEHTSELQSRENLVCRLLLEK